MVERLPVKISGEELIKAVAKRRRKIKLLAIEYKGGKRQICGYNKYPGAFNLHHIYGDKSFGIGDKCILVCANCHREIEAGITQPSEEIRNGKTR